MNGDGVFTYANGDKYDGQWKDGLKHGKGILTCADGDTYNGDWIEDKKEGKGKKAKI